MGQTTASQLLASKLLRHFNMKPLILLGLVAFVRSQYSGETQDLSNSQLDALKDIFGDAAAGGAYSGQQVGRLEGGTNGVEAIIQVVKNEEGYVAPDDYQPTAGLTDKATSNVDNVFENCADYTATQGYECVPYYQCHNGTIITDGGGLIDIRNGFGILSPEDSKCPGFLDVCCLDPDFIPPPPPPIVKHVPKCGQRHENGLGVRIQGFSEYESQFGEWPHMCAVLAEEPVAQDPGYAGEPQTVNLYQCGGSLIAPGVILTAAHCVDKFRQNPTELKIRCGEWDTQNQTEPYPHQDRYVQTLNIHPEFDGRNLHNDFALLFTSEDFVLASHIDTVCLPQADELFDGTTCFATGWGKDKFGSAGQYQVVLKEIDLPVVGNTDCQDKLRSTRLGQKYKLHDSFICAGGINGKDTCKGDGGSPLVCPSKYDPNTYIQAGIVAWGIGCGEDGTPGVYASVSKALCWIDYAMSCHYGASTGDYNSYNGYTSNVCQEWMDNKIADLEKKRDGAGKYGRIFDAQIQGFQQCTVQWDNPAAPLVDVSDFGRTQDEGYGSTETKADNTYSDTSSAVKITQTYTEDTSDLVSVKDTNTYSQDTSDLVSAKDTNIYSQDTSADILEAKAPVY